MIAGFWARYVLIVPEYDASESLGLMGPVEGDDAVLGAPILFFDCHIRTAHSDVNGHSLRTSNSMTATADMTLSLAEF